MPDATDLLPDPDDVYRLPPPKAVVRGEGRWRVDGWDGGGTVSIRLNLRSKQFTGVIEGWHRPPGGPKTHLEGRIAGRYEGTAVGGRLCGSVAYVGGRPTPPNERVRFGADAFCADFVRGRVQGSAAIGKAAKSFSVEVD
jgi:hypothetical protein